MKKFKNCDVCANNNKDDYACDFCVRSCNFIPIDSKLSELIELKEKKMDYITNNKYNDYLDAISYAMRKDGLRAESIITDEWSFRYIPALETSIPIMLPDFISKVVFNDPATIVFWADGTKTVVKAVDEPFDKEKGLAMAICKKIFGNKGNYFNVIKEWTEKED